MKNKHQNHKDHNMEHDKHSEMDHSKHNDKPSNETRTQLDVSSHANNTWSRCRAWLGHLQEEGMTERYRVYNLVKAMNKSEHESHQQKK